jgi:hypothetical protein
MPYTDVRASKRPHLINDIHPNDTWLLDLHSGIWGCEDKLFHKVEITFAHYNELEQRLMKRDPNRGNTSPMPEDVGSIKSAVLQDFHLPTSEPNQRRAENDVDLQDDDDLDSELRALFPTRIHIGYVGLNERQGY